MPQHAANPLADLMSFPFQNSLNLNQVELHKVVFDFRNPDEQEFGAWEFTNVD